MAYRKRHCHGCSQQSSWGLRGVIAFVAGFYEEFIYSLQKINNNAFKVLFRHGFKAFFQQVNGGFLSLLITGMIISYFSVSQLLDYALVHYELYVWSGFFGMIIGSIYYIAKDFGTWRPSHRIYLLIAALVGLGISFWSPPEKTISCCLSFSAVSLAFQE